MRISYDGITKVKRNQGRNDKTKGNHKRKVDSFCQLASLSSLCCVAFVSHFVTTNYYFFWGMLRVFSFADNFHNDDADDEEIQLKY